MSAENKIVGEYDHVATYDSTEFNAEEAGREDEHHYERYSAHSLKQTVDRLIVNSSCSEPTILDNFIF